MMRSPKERLDMLLVQRGCFPSRERAKAEIMSGKIYINGRMIDKPGTMVSMDVDIEVKGKAMPFVSRGGLKLEKALSVFDVKPKDKVIIDAGASTGGFTDCLLKNGAKRVFAVDVGYGQLDYRLRNDPRVVVMEKTNVRYLKLEDIGQVVDIITADLSFISLSVVFNTFYNLLKIEGDLVVLIKPQFEVERKDVGKNGVVRKRDLHKKAIARVIKSANQNNFFEWGIDFSPITGPRGNIEFLGWFKKIPRQNGIINIEKVVENAHLQLFHRKEN
ncbi:MAG: TlyA family RNA methyltransferase [Tepidanaerobacteraceae bacterium]|nr:TlyA family RNA methyltransferase [Tepidanaerobacteraceae bacterium]